MPPPSWGWPLPHVAKGQAQVAMCLCARAAWSRKVAVHRIVSSTKWVPYDAMCAASYPLDYGKPRPGETVWAMCAAFHVPEPSTATCHAATCACHGLQDDKGLVYQVQALPAAVLNYIYPPVTGDLAKVP